MASRENREEQEDSNEETDDEDYSPDDEESEEDLPQIETSAVDSVNGDRTEEDVVLVTETEWRLGRGRECEESSNVADGQLTDLSCLPCCPICFVPWTPDGPHRVCCIPCGHVYGRSCLERWIKQGKKNAAKCPQCSARFKKTEMINLYAPLIAVTNTDLEKEVFSLREKNESLELEAHATELLAEEGLTPESGNTEANERIFEIVMGPEHPGRIRLGGFRATATRLGKRKFYQGEFSGASTSKDTRITALEEEVKELRANYQEMKHNHQEMKRRMAELEEFIRKMNQQTDRDRLMEEIKKSKKMACLEVVSEGAFQRRSGHLDERWISVTEPVLENKLMPQDNLDINGSSHHRCVLQNEIPVDGARVLGIDASSKILIVSGKKPGLDGEHILNKISLLGRCEIDRIQLPPKTGAVRDLCILPGSLALIASLGKKVSLLSMFSNNLVLKYDLPVPAWSCSGDLNEPYHIYAGLQNGTLLIFDIRQTAGCLESIEGLSRFPIHSVCSLPQNHCSRKVLTASSVGPCLWDVGRSGERPFLIPESESQGICISLACGSSGSDIVASFRPKIELSGDPMPSQPLHSAWKLGSHVHLRRTNDACFQKGNVVSCHVSEVRMLKSVVIYAEGKNSSFACGDELTRGMCLWNLPSFRLHSHYQPHQYPILDMKYSSSLGLGLLGCLSENRLQVFTCF